MNGDIRTCRPSRWALAVSSQSDLITLSAFCPYDGWRWKSSRAKNLISVEAGAPRSVRFPGLVGLVLFFGRFCVLCCCFFW